MPTVAFVCQGNAGRSQLATALAEKERERRGVDVSILTGGVDPHEHVHPEVETVLAEEGIEIDREPRQIREADLAAADYVITMGCDVADIAPAGWNGHAERWELDHPGGDDLTSVRASRDEIDARVRDLFDRKLPTVTEEEG